VDIRPASPADVAAIAGIYAYHVRNGTGTFEEEPPDAAEMARRIDAVGQRGWPWLVAEDGGGVVGYAYCSQLRERPAYRFACEDSIYVAHDQHGRGAGGALLEALMRTATACGFREMFAVIGDAANAGSIRLHARAGFIQVGTWHAAGYKFGRFLDVIHMQRALIG
jgi:phosphinothricin acetyltransferase